MNLGPADLGHDDDGNSDLNRNRRRGEDREIDPEFEALKEALR